MIPSPEICYFNISYYNMSRVSFVEDDTVFVAYRVNKTVTSVKRRWKVIEIGTHAKFKFKVVGLTGM